MPTAPARPCKYNGCPELVRTKNGLCKAHQQYKYTVYKWRGSAASRGYDWNWRRIRSQALARDKYLCVHCLADGRATAAVDVDHRIPLTTAPEHRLDLDNLQSLCRPCHRAKTERDKKTQQSDTPPIDSKRL
jgi:5-methylcytosine-specific restriction protein A